MVCDLELSWRQLGHSHASSGILDVFWGVVLVSSSKAYWEFMYPKSYYYHHGIPTSHLGPLGPYCPALCVPGPTLHDF